MLEAIFLLLSAFCMFGVVFNHDFKAHFLIKILLYFISVPLVTIIWTVSFRYFT